MVPILHAIDYVTITAIVMLGVIITSKLRSSASGDQARIDRLEAKVEQLIASINGLRGQSRDGASGAIGPVTNLPSSSLSTETLSPGVRALVDQRQKIQAIKLLREETGLGLKEAKDAVDDYERRSR